jgi:hypothetical protein
MLLFIIVIVVVIRRQDNIYPYRHIDNVTVPHQITVAIIRRMQHMSMCLCVVYIVVHSSAE